MSNVSTPRSATKPLRRWLLIAHRWTGLIVGLWVVMLGLTGSALVYQHSLRQVLEQGRHIRTGLKPLPLQEVLTQVRRQRPDATVLGIRGLQYSDSALEVLIRPTKAPRDARQSKVLLVDPGTGEIQATQTLSSTPMGFLAQLHFNLLRGDTGLAINAVAGGLAIFYVVTGLILWWRGRQRWKNGLLVRWKGKNNRARFFNTHSAVGFYVSLFFIVTSISGIYFAFPMTFVSTAARLSGSSLSVVKDFLAQRPSETTPGSPDAPVDEIVTSVQAQFPGSQLMQLTLPMRPTDAWRVQFQPAGTVDTGNTEFAVVDRRSAKVIVARRTSDLPWAVRSVLLLRPLHTGTFGGNFTRALWVLLGLSPAVLLFTGFIMWRYRVAAQAPKGGLQP